MTNSNFTFRKFSDREEVFYNNKHIGNIRLTNDPTPVYYCFDRNDEGLGVSSKTKEGAALKIVQKFSPVPL